LKKFRFHLQKLLEYRKTLEDKLLAELSVIRAELDHEQSRLVAFRRDKDLHSVRMRENLANGSSEEIRDDFLYLSDLIRLIKQQEEIISKVEERRMRKTMEVLEASKQRKSLEQLKEQKKIEHRKESERQEQNFLDDIATTRYSRVNKELREAA